MLLGVLITLLIIVCVLLIAVILMQRSEGGALGMGGGGGGGFMSSRGAADLLTRTTQWLGGAFFILCLAITVVTARTQGTSLIDRANVGKIDAGLLNKAPPAEPAPVAPAPGGFQAPPPNLGGLPSTAPAPAPADPFPAAPAPTPGR